MTFGNAFGLSLYANTLDTKPKAPEPAPTETSLSRSGDTNPNVSHSEATGSEPSTAGTVVPGQEQSSPAPDNPQPSLPVTLPGPDWPDIRPLDEAQHLNQQRQERIDKSTLALSEPRRIRNSGHLAFVASRPCLICGRNRAHAHHLKFAQPTALGRKVSDEFTVPLCSAHHRELHTHGDERVWWAERGIDALAVAAELWDRSQLPKPVDSPQ